MEKGSNLVWYVSYGSNLLESRFLCYIQGGTPKGAKTSYTGCTNKSSPQASEKCLIRHQVYFAKHSETWCGGVAFIKSNPLPAYEKKTLGRKYLITKDQFIQVIRQENAKDADDPSINIDFDVAEKKCQYLIGQGNQCQWYGRMINLGVSKGTYMFTFTAKWDDNFAQYTLPSDNYLKTMMKGLKETYRIADSKIVDYLSSIPGVHCKKTRKDLETLIKEVQDARAL